MGLKYVLVLALVLGCTAVDAGAFSLTDFPDQTEIDADLVRRWREYVDNPGQPYILTYAIDAGFLAGEDPETVANITATLQAAMQSWSDATRGMIRFEPADWAAVRNVGQPQNALQGPPFDDWLTCAENCGFEGACILENCPTPGWGAHIDFFSEPTGYMVSTGGVDYEMMSCNLGFTAIHRDGANKIVSADIYLNSDWNWTTDEAQALSFSALGSSGTLERVELSCSCAELHAGVPGVIPVAADCTSEQSSLVIDLQTVLVHEVGHALGLDHSNEAASNGSPTLDPWTFASGAPVDPLAVMQGSYDGVKRVLRDDDLGGIAFLYPPEMYGDVDANGSLGFIDAFAALDVFEGRTAPDPWTVNRLDFNLRNGEIDMDELQQLLQWVIDPTNHPPGLVPSQNPGMWQTGSQRASAITIDGMTVPYDIGMGGVATLLLNISNLDQADVQGWDIRFQFNSDVLLNPRYGPDRDFLEGASLIPISVMPLGPGLSECRVGSLGFEIDNSTSGTLASVEFDIDLLAAAAVPQVDFLFNEISSEIVAATPYTHVYSQDPGIPDETLTYVPISADAYLLDVDANNWVDINDLYAFNAVPVDVNYDTVIDEFDRTTLTSILRKDEVEDVTGQPIGYGGNSLSAGPWLPDLQGVERREIGN